MDEYSDTAPDEEPLAGVSIGAVAIRALLRRLGHPNSKHSGVLRELTGLSKPQIGRRLNGKSHWVLDDFVEVCSKLGADYIEVLEAVAEPTLINATFKIGTEAFPCLMRLGPEVVSGETPRLSAVNESIGWVVSRGPIDGPAYSVQRLVFNLEDEAPRPIVAVFDDNVDACDALCDMLAIHGLDAAAFYSVADFEQSWRTRTFDGFVIDWLIPGGDAGEALSRLRSSYPNVPIAVLTGMDTRGPGTASTLANAIAKTGAVYFAKPVTTAILVAALRPAATEHLAARLKGKRR